MPKSYILYHGNCYDGFGAAWAAWKCLGDSGEYIPVNYGAPLPELEDQSDVYIVDFSYPKSVLLDLEKQMKSVIILDHHKTAWEALNNLSLVDAVLQGSEKLGARFDMNKSGAMLAWEFWHNEAPPDLINYIQDRDLWKFELSDSQEITGALRAYPMDFEVWDSLANPSGIERLRNEGKIILKFTNQLVDRMCQHVQWREVGGFVIPVVNASAFVSEVGNRLCELYPEALFSAYYVDGSDGKRHWGLRSVGEFDVSKVAQLYGGGGHRNAAGFVEDLANNSKFKLLKVL
ncbi:MAG TPA: phosphoesterase [Cyanobacteria bacterium UBA11162]|nr:phosphoesterase [Cyanobacteria bacterium UBA11162]